MNTLRIVGIGGGTGLPVLLTGLAGRLGINLSGIVTVADNGGSSGRLREGFAMPAVGDLRNCMVALSDRDSTLADLFQHRFPAGGCLEGHALGNLIVAALYQKTGSLVQAIELASRMLRLQGRAMAATEASVTLCATLRDGRIARGESQITGAAGAIERIWLEPERPPPSQGVLDAIRAADALVLAPGSLYTSLLPNLLVDGVADAIRQSTAVKILVCNLTTQPGETDGYTASDHLRAVAQYLGSGLIQFCVVNSPLPRSVSQSLAHHSQLVSYDPQRIAALGAIPVLARLLAPAASGKIRHCPDKLGRLVAKIARSWTGSLARPDRSTDSIRRYPVRTLQSVAA